MPVAKKKVASAKKSPKSTKTTKITQNHEELIKEVADKFHKTANELGALAKKIKGQYDTDTNRKILAGVAAATVLLAGAAMLKKDKKK